MPYEDYDDAEYSEEESLPQDTKGSKQKSVLLAAVMGLVLLLLALAGLAIINESGVPSEEPSFFETPTPVVETNDITPGEALEEEVEQTFCTLDAKICPDGSAVGRSGPNCEFDPCPGEN